MSDGTGVDRGPVFVGRTDSVAWLRSWLRRSHKSGPRLQVAAVTGSGGVGKTRLYREAIEYRPELVAELSYLLVYVDGKYRHHEPVEWIARSFLEDLSKEIRSRFVKSERVLEAHRKQRRRLDQKIARSGFRRNGGSKSKRRDDTREAAKTVKTILDTVARNPIAPKYIQRVYDQLKIGRKEIEEAIELIEGTGYFSPGWWRRRFRRFETSVSLDPERSMAEALVEDLRRYLFEERSEATGLLWVLDDYESMTESNIEFIHDDVLPLLAREPFRTAVLVMNRDRLDYDQRWGAYVDDEGLEELRLRPLRESDVEELCNLYGINDRLEIQRVWEESEGFPFLAEALAKMEPNSPRALDVFHARIKRWMTKGEDEWMQSLAFLDDINEDSIRYLLSDGSDPAEVLRWFKSEASIVGERDGVRQLRPYVRSRLLELAETDKPKWAAKMKKRAKEAVRRSRSRDK